jgi:hypothetical protein
MIDDRENTSTGAILEEAVAVFRRNWPLLLITGAAAGLLQFVERFENRQKLYGTLGVAVTMLVAYAVSLTTQALVGRTVLLREQLADPGTPARYGAFLGASIAYVLGIGFGVVLLIVPGVLLMLRWVLATNFTLARGLAVGDALRASRDATAGRRGAIFGAIVVVTLCIYLPLYVLIRMAGGVGLDISADPVSVVGITRVAWAVLAGMAGMAFSVGAFSVLVGRAGHLREVFA